MKLLLVKMSNSAEVNLGRNWTESEDANKKKVGIGIEVVRWKASSG